MKNILFFFALSIALGGLMGCNNTSQPNTQDPTSDTNMVAGGSHHDTVPMKLVTVGQKTYNVAQTGDSMHIYRQEAARERCFFVISKREYRLYVYEVSADKKDTALVAHFPVCYAVNKEAKTRSGDMCTPECTMDAPFTISQIQDASTWEHDFGDGRGPIKAYGAWFMRLETPGFKGIGIHGSTNNEASVPGRDSEGCIRLRDSDLIVLHDRYAQVGTHVVILPF